MRPNMRSQSATNSFGGGLPICLSGIGIQPRSQLSNRYSRLPIRNEGLRTRPYFRQNSITESEMHHLETAICQRLEEIAINEGSERGDSFQQRPRHAVALQMADLDRRREAIRKHRSNRGMVFLMDEQRTVSGERSSISSSSRMNSVIHAVMQHPSFQYEFDRELQRHKCAKAA